MSIRKIMIIPTLGFSLLLAGCQVNTSVGVVTLHDNHHIKVSFVSMSGTMDIGTVTSNQQGKIEMPYMAKVGSGQLELEVKSQNGSIAWSQNITPSKTGEIALQGSSNQSYSIIAVAQGTAKHGVINIGS